MDKEHMKGEITKLIEKYNREKSKRYNEEATKNDFILPLFKILGWNTEDSNEVSKEENISGKRVDYGFRIDGIPKFFLEAKGLDEDLEGSRTVKGRQVTYAEQAINYAYYKGCNWAILTNFKGIIVYDAWAKANSQSSFRFAIWIDSLLSDFESVYLLSKEAFEQGLLDKKYSTKSRKRPITEQLLLDFTNFRAILSKDVYALNKSKNLTEEELDEAIQRLFDRLIFVRNCEDRELEPYELLSALRQWKESRKGTLVSKLRELFVHFDETYNSKIFSKHLCDQVDISDNALCRILDGLYTTEDGSIQYDFSLIDADILGNIYEQYLGHILKKTEKRTKLTESKAKRKEEGIYYTPSYIVDYIVRNTVGELVKNKKVDISKIKILDPACGSGSFLIKTFDVLNEYYSKKEAYNQNKLDMSGAGTTYSTKLSILKDNIFGVDLDKQAVDIAQLNLLLKVAEKKKRLPILQQNIKNGNSLIDDPNLVGDKAFRWNEEFAEIKNTFDIIIGNPPWVQSKFLNKEDKEYYTKNYTTAKRQYDLFTLFIEKGLRLLKEEGVLGFIVPDRFIANSDYEIFRKFLLDNTKIKQIVQVGEGVFTGVEMPSAIIILEKCDSKASRNIVNVRLGLTAPIQKVKQIDFVGNEGFIFSIFNDNKFKPMIQKMEKIKTKLSEFVINGRGVEIGKKSVAVSGTSGDVKFLIGSDIDRYQIKGHHYLKLGAKGINYKEPELYKGEKILVRKTGLGINAVLDENNYVIQVIYLFKPKKEDVNLHYILGILNSKLMNLYYFSKFGQKERKVFPHLTQGKILQLPIKFVKENEKALTSKVDEMLNLYAKLNQLGNKKTDENNKISEEINKIDAQIDDLVYKIYGITEEEKKVIKENIK
jgi:type I restriction-modification system DNA methylase subunit